MCSIPRSCCSLTLLTLLGVASARAEDGVRTFARWEPDGYFYPVKVEKEGDGKTFVRYADDVTEWAPSWRVGKFDLKVGDVVYGNWKNKGLYYPGKLARRDGDKIKINYDDGDVEETTIAALRLKLIAPAARQVNCAILARWGPDGYWYTGVVKEIKDGKRHIHFDDGDKAWVTDDEVIGYQPTFDDAVEGNWKAGGKYYPGRIAKRNGEKITINYDDGDVEETSLTHVRMRIDRVKFFRAK